MVVHGDNKLVGLGGTSGFSSVPAALNDTDVFDQSPWEAIARESPELADNPAGAEHLAYRFAGKYLPALLRSKTTDEKERVWLAFWSYIIARATDRKPFGMSQEAADLLIAQFQKALSERA
jgi:hypothetical protein